MSPRAGAGGRLAVGVREGGLRAVVAASSLASSSHRRATTRPAVRHHGVIVRLYVLPLVSPRRPRDADRGLRTAAGIASFAHHPRAHPSPIDPTLNEQSRLTRFAWLSI